MAKPESLQLARIITDDAMGFIGFSAGSKFLLSELSGSDSLHTIALRRGTTLPALAAATATANATATITATVVATIVATDTPTDSTTATAFATNIPQAIAKSIISLRAVVLVG